VPDSLALAGQALMESTAEKLDELGQLIPSGAAAFDEAKAILQASFDRWFIEQLKRESNG
jgi:hypothetical protein